MTKRKRTYLFFSGLIGLLWLGVFFVRPSEAFLFENAKGDCSGRSRFMYNALYKDKKNADVVLFGSSRTMNDVNDSLMNSAGKKRFLNLGYCRFGRNLDYFFIEAYCNKHRPSKIVLEVREEEGSGTHPLTAFLLPVSKVIEDGRSFRLEVFKNLYDKWLCNLKFMRGTLFSDLPGEPAPLIIDHGFWYGNKITDIKPLIEKRAADSIANSKSKHHQEAFNANSRYYFKKLKRLCQDKNIELNFVYLPSYGNIGGLPGQFDVYGTYGKTFVPPDSIVKDVLNFSDFGHLNKRGADLLSLWLLEQL